MPRLESTITIDAPRDAVIAVARDNSRFPEFMNEVKSLTVTETSADGLRVISDWVGLVPRFALTVRWTEEDIWDLDAGTCTFRQLKGDYDEFAGMWTFTADGESRTRFDSYLDYRLEIPLVGGVVKALVQKLIQSNLDATLAAIKARCESSQNG